LGIDVALVHVPAVDLAGNVYVEGDLGADGLMARAARRTVVSYEQRGERDPRHAAVSRLWVEGLAHAPRGAWPCGCYPIYEADLDVARAWARDSRRSETLAP
jgi:hypothetical protein